MLRIRKCRVVFAPQFFFWLPASLSFSLSVGFPHTRTHCLVCAGPCKFPAAPASLGNITSSSRRLGRKTEVLTAKTLKTFNNSTCFFILILIHIDLLIALKAEVYLRKCFVLKGPCVFSPCFVSLCPLVSLFWRISTPRVCYDRTRWLINDFMEMWVPLGLQMIAR